MERISSDEFSKRYGGETLSGLQQYKSARTQSSQTPFRDFAAGAVDSITAPGRALQGVLPNEISTVPNFSTGEQGQRANDIGKDARFANFGATAGTDAANAGEAAGLVAELLLPTGAAAKGTRALSGLGGRLSSFSDDVIEGGTKVKERLIDAVSSLDDKTKTALERSDRPLLDRFLKNAEEASKDDRVRTPLESVGDDVIDALRQVKNRASQAGEAKGNLLESANVGFQKVGNIAQKSVLDIQKTFSGKKLDKAEQSLISDVQGMLKGLGDNPQLKEVDAVIDLIQDRLYKTGRQNVLEVTDRTTGPLRAAIGKLNSQLQEVGGSAYKQANQDYSELISLTRELNARLGKEGASAGSLVKRLFSPSDGRTKELFSELESLTGNDFVRDARLAKFTMEVFGDTRAQSLLQQLPKDRGGLIDRAIDFAVDKVSDPAQAARRFIDRGTNP